MGLVFIAMLCRSALSTSEMFTDLCCACATPLCVVPESFPPLFRMPSFTLALSPHMEYCLDTEQEGRVHISNCRNKVAFDKL